MTKIDKVLVAVLTVVFLGALALVIYPLANHERAAAEKQTKYENAAEMIQETFPQYEWTNFSLFHAVCYEQRGRYGIHARCYEPTDGDTPIPYGITEVEDTTTGEKVLIQLFATSEGPVFREYVASN